MLGLIPRSGFSSYLRKYSWRACGANETDPLLIRSSVWMEGLAARAQLEAVIASTREPEHPLAVDVEVGANGAALEGGWSIDVHDRDIRRRRLCQVKRRTAGPTANCQGDPRREAKPSSHVPHPSSSW